MTPSSNPEERLRAWLQLHAARGLDSVTRQTLLEKWGDPQAVVAAHGQWRDAAPQVQLPDPQEIRASLAWLEGQDNHLVCLDDPDYPALLRQIPGAPLVLFAHGQRACLGLPALAMVGSRNPTPTGAETARAFSAHLAGAGLLIVSGLALGIDAAAHTGALDGGGATIAVLGTGVDRVYPASHHQLAHRIAANGLLLSELPLGAPPRRQHFPARNRIISGLALGTLVVEASLRSGSLITARLAGEQGREVFAIPGSIHAPQSRGCHALIRQGAKLVETAADVLEELAPLAAAAMPRAAPARAAPVDEALARLLELMSFDPVNVDTLVERSGLTAAKVCSMLLALELQGLVENCPGGTYIRLP